MRYLWSISVWVSGIALALLSCIETVNWYTYLTTGDWIRVDAELTRVEVVDYDNQPMEMAEDDRWDGRGYLNVSYKYTFDDVVYTNDRVTAEVFRDTGLTIRRHIELRRAYQAGNAVSIWLDPDDPGKAFIYREINIGMYLFPALGGLFFVAVWLDRRRQPIADAVTQTTNGGAQ